MLACAMTLRKVPHLAHWGAFTAVTERGHLIGCEPFFADSNPSPMLQSIPQLVYSDKRIRQPMVRRSWLKARENSDRTLRGREDFVAVDWETALDLVAEENRRVRDRYGASGIFTGSYGWSSAGRVNHARTLVRRFYFNGGGGVDQMGNYSWGAAQFFLPYVIGTWMPLTGRVTDWPSVIEHAEVVLAFGGLALKNAQVASGGAGEHTLKPALEKLVAKGTRVINVSPMRDDCPDFLNADWIAIRPNTDVALMLALGYEIERRGAARRIPPFLPATASAIRSCAPICWESATAWRKRPPGPAPLPASRRSASPNWRASLSANAALLPVLTRCSARIAANSPTG